jgi:deoxyxylulose-5-phosphate synthase
MEFIERVADMATFTPAMSRGSCVNRRRSLDPARYRFQIGIAEIAAVAVPPTA